MSGNGKRILPPSVATTSALIPITPGALNGNALVRSAPNEDLINQLVGGLIQTDQPKSTESGFFNRGPEHGAQDRIYSIDDEEIDEPPVPIPSTWHDKAAKDEPSWVVEQLRASAYGFVIGLFVVIPAVMLLTGQAERLPSWEKVSQYALATTAQLGLGDTLKDTVPEAPPIQKTPVQIPEPAVALETAPATTAATPTSIVASHSTTPSTVSDTTATSVTAPSLTVSGAEASATDKLAVIAPANTPAAHAAAPITNPELTRDTDDAQAGPAPVDRAATSPATPNTPTPNIIADNQAAAPAANETVKVEPAIVTPTPVVTVPSGPVQTTAAKPKVNIDKPSVQSPASRDHRRVASIAKAAPPPSPIATKRAKPRAAAPRVARPPAARSPVNIASARNVINQGDIVGARVMLARLASEGDSEAIFALAETFDPNVLAAWGTHGEEANPEKAKMFYAMALSQGVIKASQRIEALE